MKSKEQIQEPVEKILPQQVWKTLDVVQQQAVLQTIVNLCQQIILIWEKGQTNDQHPDR